ncbi:hypothetical protein GLAREA_00623 [Glarea lozoyensis ATCC 20868]|uniref:Carboxylesterase family protein n=1 Tax=Glarea lozoyensis (strain ATCC 20868 / MF5171) TaxID=1116229 RepID=S3DSQ6_GLAL2|nr:uncharacterized protein GLAREA_00623 [Glarea lozoyensis ATCC 20868]EPE29463.1 hypothetical protein GLAREA_00623 [Glarea lozoyensis ATCC 20868]
MSRVTRSRKIDIAEDVSEVSDEAIPRNIISSEPALIDISNQTGINNMSSEASSLTASVPSHIKQLKAAYRNAIGTKKNKKARSKKKDGEDTHRDVSTESSIVVNNENHFQGGDAPEFSLPVPAQDTGLMALLDTLTMENAVTSNGIDEAERRAVNPTTSRVTRRQLAQQKAAEESLSSSLKGDSALSTSEQCSPNNEEFHEQPSPLIHTPMKEFPRSPVHSAARTLEEVEETCAKQSSTPTQVSDDDSFVEQIISRSPAKSVSRIEDTVEALDQLEDAMDAVTEAALVDYVVSTKTSQSPTRVKEARSKSFTDKPQVSHEELVAQAVRSEYVPKQVALKSGSASVRIKQTATNQAPGLRKSASMSFRPPITASKTGQQSTVIQPPKTLSRRPTSLMQPKEPVKSTKQLTRPAFELPGEAVARRLKEQREARLAQRQSSEEDISSSRILSGPKTIKSTKAPTKSNFELPGEALSRKKKEAHEARLKAREEEERKRREFKAKPVRKSLVPDYIPRETAASRARQSRIGIENINELAVSKRNSTIGAHHPSIQQLNLANCSAPRAPGPKPTRKPSTTSGPSMSGLAVQRTVSDKEVHLQRQRAREIYNRDARLTEEMEREKQEREAAAKRAREAAAERGRQASREWAERQRVRKLAEGDRGLGAGYGPGGQMGLK